MKNAEIKLWVLNFNGKKKTAKIRQRINVAVIAPINGICPKILRAIVIQYIPDRKKPKPKKNIKLKL